MVRLISANLRPYVPTRSQHEKVRSQSEAVEFSGVLIFGVTSNEGPASFSPKINVALSAASDVSPPARASRAPLHRILPPISRHPLVPSGFTKADRCRLMTCREES